MEFDNNTPIYIQVMNMLKRQIVSGGLQSDDKLPSVRELAINQEFTGGENISISVIGLPSISQFFSNGLSSYALMVFIIYFSIVVLSMYPRNNHITFIKVILAVLLTNIVNIFVGGVTMLLVAIPFAIKHGFSVKIPDITRFSDYMQNSVQELNVVNIIINILVVGIFYLITKNIIENNVQL